MNFEEEMSRFEAEINRTTANAAAAAAFLGANPAVPLLDPSFLPAQIHARAGLPPPPPLGYAPPSAPPPMMRPTKVMLSGSATITKGPQTNPEAVEKNKDLMEEQKEEELDIFSKLAQYEQEHKKEKKETKKTKKKAKTSFTPSTVTATSSVSSAPPPPVNLSAPPPPPPPAAKSFHQGAAASSSTPLSATISDETFKKAKKQKRAIRTGGGQVWEDSSLKEWDTNDFRLFCGDLGNDVTDEVLARTFGRYTSFQKAKVIRDKKSNKTKGYGFVSFKDPTDFTRAMREMNGKYVGSRPIKLRKSNWKDRNIDVVKSKQKVKQQMGYKW